MKNKDTDKAGIYPYIIENGVIKICFMIPSNPKFGGKYPQMAKGGIDSGYSALETALKEGAEELGLISSNIVETKKIGVFPYKNSLIQRMHLFVCNVNTVEMNPHGYETKEIIWMDIENALTETRPDQRYFLKKVKEIL